MLKRLVTGLIVIVAGFGGFLLLNRYFAWYGPQQLEMGEVVNKVPRSDQEVFEQIPWKLEVFSHDLEVPWSIVFTGDERLIVSERPGRIRQVIGGKLSESALIEFAEVSNQDEEGLMGLAIDPEYEKNRYLYACYAYPGDTGLVDKIVRLVDQGESLLVDRVLLDNIPAARFHAGCELAFGPDGKLYITTGDATKKQLAQDKSSLAGKILRLNSDGTLPEDNPFDSFVWSYGHRNPQGIAWHPESQLLYASEHGPSVIDGPAGGDEINLIEEGLNYGWPLVSHQESLAGTQAPLITFTPAEAPGSVMFYSGKIFPQYKNQMFMAALKGQGIIRVHFDPENPKSILDYEKLDISVGRVREIVEGPDGFIYFTTSNRDGRGKPDTGDDKIYRLVPAN